MDQNQDQNDNLFNFDKKPETPSDEPTILSGSGGARVYETPPAQQPAEPFPAYTPPPPSYTPPSGPAVPPPANKNRTWLIILIVILVLLCCCCLAFALSGWFVWGDPLWEYLTN
jgi:hypothetical protein